jgi:diaminohydroxyphosphoribosylaminopyrimidine deaminase/5-amino-6-(5-phosphoribosylamino)uracil reductase
LILTSDSKFQISDFDARMMRRALELAAQGTGQVSPSPLVGCVIVKDGEIVGEGFYLYEKIKHAETVALEQAGARAQDAAAYISLEPHDHQGRTPPCTEALIRAGIKRVVAPIEDPNPLVAGKGFRRLRAAGIEVETGLLAEEATRLNEKYIHFMRRGRPFVHLKLACSLDGKIATRTRDARWITNAQSRARVHELRHEYDAILIGAGTVAADDPLLTDRSGLVRHRPLVRVVLDGGDSCFNARTQLARTARQSPVLAFVPPAADEKRIAELKECGVEIVRADESQMSGDEKINLDFILRELARRSIISLLVEGGATVAGAFLDARLVNKASFFYAPIIIGGDAVSAVAGAGAHRISDAARLRDMNIVRRDDDLEVTGYLAGK